MGKLIDQYGQPFDLKEVAEPQTARVVALQNTYIEGQLSG